MARALLSELGRSIRGAVCFGRQIVAQALRAAARTVDAEQEVQSLRAYFIRRVLAGLHEQRHAIRQRQRQD